MPVMRRALCSVRVQFRIVGVFIITRKAAKIEPLFHLLRYLISIVNELGASVNALASGTYFR